MKSKHFATYGKEAAHSSDTDYHRLDNLCRKSTIAAPARTAIAF